MTQVLSKNDREDDGTYTFPALKKNNAKTGKMNIVTTREITRFEIMVIGIILIYSPMIHDNPKYNGTNITMVVVVQKNIAFP